jgi:UDPglucose 6-dehydrogenase
LKVCVVGTGYVGLVTGTCLAETGNDVICADVDSNKIARLKNGEVPIYEPDLDTLIARNVEAKRLSFSDDVAESIRRSEIVFIGVGTPPRSDGSADLRAVDDVAVTVARHAVREVVLVTKSTVPVGTNARVRRLVADAPHRVHVVSNPEFLKEGQAVVDFMRPDRVVVGCDADDEFARDRMARLYHPFNLDKNRLLWMDPASAELTKYVANTMLAMRISFMNEIASLCEKVGADIHRVRAGVGSDTRIGPKFLYAGPGYGGSCLAGSETVLVRSAGKTRLVELERLFAELEPEAADVPETSVVAPSNLEVLAWDPETGRAEVRAVSALTRRPFEGELVDVRTKMGRRVRCTPDHPFVVRDAASGRTSVALASELRDDSWLPVAYGAVDHGEAARAIDLLEVLPQTGVSPLEVIVRLDARDRERLDAMGIDAVDGALRPLGHPRKRERARDILRTGALRLDEATHLGLAMEHATFGTERNGTYVPRRIALDDAFFRILGLYLAQGHVSVDGRRHRLSWSFHPTNEASLVDEVQAFWTERGVKCDVWQRPTTRSVTISSRLLAGVFVRVLGLGADCYTHRVPDAIWAASSSSRQALLSGLWQGDGSWSLVSGGPSVVFEYGTVSRLLADGMLRLLASEGLVARLKVMRPQKATRRTYFLSLSGADQVERALYLAKTSDREAIARSIASQKKRIAPTGYRNEPAGTFVRVAKIGRRPFRGFVYSLEVPGPETVVTSHGLVVHNCFPKDVLALVHTGRDHGIELELASATDRVNQRQKGILARKLRGFFDGDLRGKRIGVWGIAFKPYTDDIRESPALTLIETLLSDGAVVLAHDPEALANARTVFGSTVELCEDAYQVAEGSDALVLVTEWREYQNPDFERLKKLMRKPCLLDGRNIWSSYELAREGFRYEGIGVLGD